uniref:propanoyl-CoA C-acyltransferase n=1 Tax=Clytia hemisphaerica TaxID=252671 RepID=A0A7M5V1N5_9CNID
MERGSLGLKWTDRAIPADRLMDVVSNTYGISGAPMTTQIFGNAGREHMEKYGTKPEHFAKIAEKNHRHSMNNPLSQFRDEYTLEQIMNAKMVHEPLTKLQCCPTSDGGAAAIVVSEDYVIKHNLQDKAVEILAMEMATDMPGVYGNSSIKACGQDMTIRASDKAFKKANLTVNDAQVVELHDCFATNELITYEGLGLCPMGKAGEFIDRGDNTYGGKFVVNPSGGLISKGHPLGATGMIK